MTRDENLIRSEDELRSALRSLERHAPTLESVLAVLDQPGGRRRRHRTRPANRRQLAAIALASVIALAVAVSLAVVPGTATRHAPAENVVSLRHAILTAFNRTSGDILYAHQPWGRRPHQAGHGFNGILAWYAPWQPLPGQQGRIRVTEFKNGKVYGDSLLTYKIPANATRSLKLTSPWIAGVPIPVLNTGPGKTRPDAHDVDVDYSHRSVYFQSGHIMNVVDYSVVLRKEIGKGQWRIGKHATIDGHQAIELVMRNQSTVRAYPGPGRYVPGHQIVQLWVNAHTHLPVRLVSFIAISANHSPNSTSPAKTNVAVTDYQFLAPSAANLAKLQMPIPKGFSHYVATSNNRWRRVKPSNSRTGSHS